MSNRLSTEKAQAIAAEYLTNGYNKVSALITVGYKHSYAIKGGLKLWDNVLVKQAIARIQAKQVAKTDETITDRLKRFAELADIALKKGDLTNSLRAEENKSKIRGDYERDNQQQGNNLAAILINYK